MWAGLCGGTVGEQERLQQLQCEAEEVSKILAECLGLVHRTEVKGMFASSGHSEAEEVREPPLNVKRRLHAYIGIQYCLNLRARGNEAEGAPRAAVRGIGSAL